MNHFYILGAVVRIVFFFCNKIFSLNIITFSQFFDDIYSSFEANLKDVHEKKIFIYKMFIICNVIAKLNVT